MRRFSAGRRHHLVHEHIREEAIAWLVGFCEEEIDADGRERFERWLKASPENVRAYLQIAALWEAASESRNSHSREIDELVRRAAAETNVLELRPTAPYDAAARPAVSVRASARRAGLVAASLAAAAVLAAIGLWWRQSRPTVYATTIGEERTLTLPDSSTVVLDARSRIQVRFTKSARLVRLVRGQALFRVIHNASRPFVVTTEDATIRDVGTQFDIRYDGAATVVTVLEGRVAASTSSDDSAVIPGGARDVLVSAGQQVRLERHLMLRPVSVNPVVATAWVQGKLVFNDTPLSEVIAAFNRYNLRPLIVEDPQLLALHVSGTFDTTNSAQVVEFLCQRFHLVAHEGASSIRLRRN